MAKIEKYVKQVDYLWYHADITDEQLAEWKKNEDAIYNINKTLPSKIGKIVSQIEFAQNTIKRT